MIKETNICINFRVHFFDIEKDRKETDKTANNISLNIHSLTRIVQSKKDESKTNNASVHS